MLKVTPSRIPLNKLKTKNRKNKFKTLRGRKKTDIHSKTLRRLSQDCKIKRS